MTIEKISILFMLTRTIGNWPQTIPDNDLFVLMSTFSVNGIIIQEMHFKRC